MTVPSAYSEVLMCFASSRRNPCAEAPSTAYDFFEDSMPAKSTRTSLPVTDAPTPPLPSLPLLAPPPCAPPPPRRTVREKTACERDERRFIRIWATVRARLPRASASIAASMEVTFSSARPST